MKIKNLCLLSVISLMLVPFCSCGFVDEYNSENYDSYYNEGYEEGYEAGRESGYNEGLSDGATAVWDKLVEDGVLVAIEVVYLTEDMDTYHNFYCSKLTEEDRENRSAIMHVAVESGCQACPDCGGNGFPGYMTPDAEHMWGYWSY